MRVDNDHQAIIIIDVVFLYRLGWLSPPASPLFMPLHTIIGLYVITIMYISFPYLQLSLFISSLLVFVVFAFASPYTCRKAYYMEALLLLDLVLVSGIFLNSDSKVQQRMLWLTSLLLILPYFVAILYFICKFIAFLW